MLFLFLAAFYGLCFYLFCAPLFWLALQFVPDLRQRQHALRALGTLGLGLLALLAISFVPIESLSASISTLVGTRQKAISVTSSATPAQESLADYAERRAAEMTLEDLRHRYHHQALP